MEAVKSAKINAAALSIGSNLTLVVLKLLTGFWSGSISVISEAIHSASDLLASIIAFVSVRYSDHPADQEHPYGHGKIESISSLAEALLIFGAALFIIHEAVTKLQHPTGLVPSLDAAMAVMLCSTVVNFFISRHLHRVAEQTDSLALLADAEHLRTDVITSAGVLVGLLATRLTGRSWIDPLVGLGVAFLILEAAWQLCRSSMAPLLDARLPLEEEERIRAVLNADPKVLGYHKLRTRKSGSSRHVDLHLMLDDQCTLIQAHDIAEQVEESIRAVLPQIHVNIHVEPFEAETRHQIEEHGLKPEEVNEKVLLRH